MITLFRRIRQKLIDSGSVTKYILYAFGEILLVVIGILIALQVNNWNEERLEKREQEALLVEVLNALDTDSITFRLSTEMFDSTFNVYEQLFQISEGILNADSLKNADYMRNAIPYKLVSNLNYPNLASSVLDTDVKKKVHNYYLTLSAWDFVVDEYNRYIENESRAFLGQYRLLNYRYHFFPEIDANRKVNVQKLIAILPDPEVQQHLFEAAQKTRNYVGFESRFYREREELIHEIERVLD